MIVRKALLAVLTAVLFPQLGSCAEAPVPARMQGTLYVGFTLVDPETRSRTPDTWLVEREGLIAELGTGAPPAGTFDVVHDMSGLYGMPGMIDAHAHITIGPFTSGATSVGFVSQDAYSRFNGAMALAFGITSVRNPAGSTTANARYDVMVAAGHWPGPEALHAGAIIQPPPFGGESFAYPQTPQEWDEEAATQAAAGMRYFKLYTDLTEDELREGVRAAKAHGLIPIAHLNDVSWTRAVDLGIQQIEHLLPTSADLLEPEARARYTPNMPPQGAYFQWFELADLKGPLITEMVQKLVEKQIAVNLTTLVHEITYNADDMTVVFPEDERLYLHPDSFASARANFDALATIWQPEHFARARAVFPKVLEFGKLLYDAGVPLMIGTDGAGGGPIYARELHNHVQAGIEPWEVLRMATSGNATLMGIGAETGRIVPGMQADLVFLRADPAADVRNTREVDLVVSNGRAYRHADLVAGAQRQLQ